MEKEIPQAVKNEAIGLIELFGEKLQYIGQYKSRDAFLFMFPKNMLTGFPYVYLYDTTEDKATEITGFEALNLLCEIEDGEDNHIEL